MLPSIEYSETAINGLDVIGAQERNQAETLTTEFHPM